MGEQVVFKRSAFGGFDRGEVLQYIDTLNTNAQKAREELESQLTAVTRSRDDFARKVSSFDVTIGQLEAQLASEQERSSRLTQDLMQSNAELQNTRLREGQRLRELALEQEKNRQLNDRIDGLRTNAAKYDELSSQIGNILMDAQAHAGQIQAQAQAQADERIRAAQQETHRAQETSAAMLLHLNGLRRQMGELKLNVAQTTQRLYAQIDELDGQIRTLCAEWGGEADAQDAVDDALMVDDTAQAVADEAAAEETQAIVEAVEEASSRADDAAPVETDNAADFFRFAAEG